MWVSISGVRSKFVQMISFATRSQSVSSRSGKPGKPWSIRPTPAGNGTMLNLPRIPCAPHHSPHWAANAAGMVLGILSSLS